MMVQKKKRLPTDQKIIHIPTRMGAEASIVSVSHHPFSLISNHSIGQVDKYYMCNDVTSDNASLSYSPYVSYCSEQVVSSLHPH